MAQQPGEIKFKRLSNDDGLSTYSIKALERDAAGFLWIGTSRGLDRYSGVRVHSANRNPASSVDLIDDDINAIVQDPVNQDVIWIGTENGGLSRFDAITEDFTNFVSDSSSISAKKILALYPDRQRGLLWIGTDAGLSRFDWDSGSFELYHHTPGNSNSLIGDSVAVIYEPVSMPGKLLLGTKKGLCILDISTGNFQKLTTVSGTNAPLSQMSITAIADVSGSVWFGTDDGSLFRYEPVKQSCELINYSTGSGPVENISALTASKYFPAVLWIGTQGQGLFALNTESLVSAQYTTIAGKSGSLSSPDVNAIIEDDEGIIWVGTRLGLDKALLRNSFKPYLIARDSQESLNGSFVITHDASKASNGPSVLTCYNPPSQPDIVWGSLLREGLWRYHRRTGSFERELSLPKDLNFILAIYEDFDRNLWLAGKHTSLFRWNRSTNEVKPFQLVASGELVIYQIYEMESLGGILWLATSDLGLLKFNIEYGTVVKAYSTDSTNTSRLSSNYVWSVYESPFEPGILWLSTRYGGLNRLDTKTDSVTIFRKNETSLSYDDIIVATSTQKDLMWLGTFGGGLVKYDISSDSCKSYLKSAGLPETDVSAIFIDRKDRLWLSTSNGLSLFDPARESFTNFTVEDGLQSNVFHYQARYRNASGEIFLGGTKGFNIFNPDSVVLNEHDSKVAITGFFVDGKPDTLVRNESGFEPISLDFFENDITFEFAVLDLRQPFKNRYKVKLEGAVEDWQQIGTQTSIRYPFLSPSSYTFHVKGSNSDGFWSEESASLSFRILPPFWQTWWFWTILVTAAFGLVIGAFQYRIAQLKRLENTRKRIADDLHDDIGSKMSSIALMMETTSETFALEELQKKQITEITDTAREVVDDLRDAVWFVDAGNDDLAALIRRMKQVTRQLLIRQKYHFTKPESLPGMQLEMEARRNLFLLYKEMLHNVVRHAKASEVEIQIGYNAGQLTISVRDDGVGFDAKKVRRGRGQATMKTRANELHAHLDINSTPGEGTTQQVTLKLV